MIVKHLTARIGLVIIGMWWSPSKGLFNEISDFNILPGCGDVAATELSPGWCSIIKPCTCNTIIILFARAI